MQNRHSTVTLDNAAWTAIRPSIDCLEIKVFNNGAATMKLRTNQADASTEWPVPSLQEYIIVAPRNSQYRLTDIVVYGQLTAGSYAVNVRCIAP